MEHPDARNDDFNLSTAQSTTVLELAEVIWRKIKGDDAAARASPTRPTSTTSPGGCPSTEKAKRVLGFEATTSLDEMLDEVIPWIEQAVADGRI